MFTLIVLLVICTLSEVAGGTQPNEDIIATIKEMEKRVAKVEGKFDGERRELTAVENDVRGYKKAVNDMGKTIGTIKDTVIKVDRKTDALKNTVREIVKKLAPTVLSSEETDGFWGDWGDSAFCPEDQFVYGYRLRSLDHQGSGDDIALEDIELRCARIGNTGSYTTIHSYQKNYKLYGRFHGYEYCSDGDNPVIGFNMKISPKQGSALWQDDTAANKVDLYCKKGGYISAETSLDWGSWTRKQMCPSGQAVMGISTRVDKSNDPYDQTALNGVRLYCKIY